MIHEESEWEAFINRAYCEELGKPVPVIRRKAYSYEKLEPTRFDKIAELAVSSYNLDEKTRYIEHMDQVNFFILWWQKNKGKFNTYFTASAIGRLLKKDHATVLHHCRHRKPSINYKENTSCIKDFLES